MNKLLAFAAVTIVTAFAGFAGLIGSTTQASACGACSPTTIVCADGTKLTGPAAQANLLVAACNGHIPRPGSSGPKPVISKAPPPAIAGMVKPPKAVGTPRVAKTRGGKCGPNSPAPAIDIGLGLTWTCDSQPFAGGYNLKPLGETKPLRVDGCLMRLHGTGGIYNSPGNCKINVSSARLISNALYVTGTKGSFAVKVVITKGAFGYSVKKQ